MKKVTLDKHAIAAGLYWGQLSWRKTQCRDGYHGQ